MKDPMKTLLTTLTLVSLTAFTATAATEENINETRAAKAGGTVVVDVDFGSIDLAPGAADQVVIQAHRKVEASSKQKEEEYLKAAPIRITTEGNKVIIRATRKHDSLGSQFWNMFGRHSAEARYTIRVPANFNADLDTAGGDISASGLTGSIKVDTSGGDLTFQKIHGEIKADTSGGDIKVATCEGRTNLDTSGGHIEVTESRGDLDADTSGGNITVMNLAGSAKVESSGGKLRLANISGKLHAETSGGAISAILPATVSNDVHLETSAGSITVMTPPNAGLTIDASTSSGGVRSDLPITNMRSDDDSLKGNINGGGKRLVLRSGAGSIEIVSADRQTAQQ
jgi:putative adhesin